MPNDIKITIVKARNLPIMDRNRDNSNAYCKVRLRGRERN